MRMIITGATSFVGAAAIKEILKNGHEVWAVVRPDSQKLSLLTEPNEEAFRDGRLHIVENDLSEPWELPQKVGKGFDVFCHFGWGGSGSAVRNDRELQEKNLKDSLNTMRAAKELGCRRFLFSGSQAEYGMHREQMTEETACSPRSAYGEAKLKMRFEGGRLAKELNMTYIHGRIFSAYGPGDHPWTLVESCLDAFLSESPVSLGRCEQKWNFLYISDLARAVYALITVPEERLSELESPVFNLAGDDTRPLREFVEEIHAVCGKKGACIYGARAENAEGAVNLIPDISKICRITGWIPAVNFKEGIKKTLEAR